MPPPATAQDAGLSLGTLHSGQVAAYWALRPHRFKALRCGRRFGKTDFAKTWISEGLVRGWECGWFAPQHMTWSEVYSDLAQSLRPILDTSSKGGAVMRMRTGGRLDFWSLENSIAGRSRRYRRIVIDEAAFAKDGDNKVDGSLMEIWEKSMKPTLFDYGGEALVCSNSAGKNPDNFFYNIRTDPEYGFHEHHARTMDNPLLPKRLQNESIAAWLERQKRFQAELIRDNDPLVYAQEYLAEFVDWAGVAFFSREKLLEQGQPVPYPITCDAVFAIIDTASKTGTDHDATAVTYFAVNKYSAGLEVRFAFPPQADMVDPNRDVSFVPLPVSCGVTMAPQRRFISPWPCCPSDMRIVSHPRRLSPARIRPSGKFFL
jgi:hypothetical protein